MARDRAERTSGERKVVFEFLDELILSIKAGLPATLSTGYLFGASGPLTPKARRRIVQRVIKYVESGRTDLEMYDSKGDVTTDRSKKWASIHEINKPGHFITLTGLHASVTAGDGKSSHIDLRPMIEFTVRRRVEQKILLFASGLNYDRKVLLLTKQFVHVEEGEMTDILTSMTLTGNQLDVILLVTLDDDYFYPGDGTVRFTPANSAHPLAVPGRWLSYPPSFEGWKPRVQPLK